MPRATSNLSLKIREISVHIYAYAFVGTYNNYYLCKKDITHSYTTIRDVSAWERKDRELDVERLLHREEFLELQRLRA